MSAAAGDPGSFRDPGGRVFLDGPRVLRTVMPSSAEAYAAVRDAGLYDKLAERGLMLASAEVDPAVLSGVAPDAAFVLEHPRAPFISYPYEWTFTLHKRAALLQLDLHIELLKSGFTLTDATAYNVQFLGARPVFIDHLSIRPYRDGEFWTGHRQFCQQYLNPLLMWALLGVQPNAWFRGALEGIPPEDLAPLLPLGKKLSWTVLTHVAAQAALQKRAVRSGGGGGAPRGRLPLNGYIGMLEGLRAYIARLELKDKVTVWSAYAGQNSYMADEVVAKRRFVGEAVAAAKPNLLLDLGCNTGDYSQVALEAGAGYVVGFDYDFGALEQACSRFDGAGSFLPLWLDAANPSPAQGWAQQERMGLAQRAQADFIIALAFIHHIVIGRNVPLGMALDWLVGMAPQGVIEFPPKSDPMVQRLLASREDIFPDYSVEAFTRELERRAKIVKSERLAENGRVLVWYDRTARV